MSFILQQEAQGLSFAARATLATLAMLTVETQCEAVSAALIKSALAISDTAWSDIREELYSKSRAFEGYDADRLSEGELVCLWDPPALLRLAIGAGGRPSSREWAALRDAKFTEAGHRCIYCQATGPLALDHIVPVARGGSNHPSNLVAACRPCNSSKGSKLIEEWWPTRPGQDRVGAA